MLKCLDTVPEDYFYQVFAARDTGKRTRLKVFWGGLYIAGLFLLFSCLFVYNSHPRVDYSYYCNLVYIMIYALQIFGLLLFAIPGFAEKHQKLYWIFFLINSISFQIGGINMCIAVMGLESLPYGFFLLMLFVLFIAIWLSYFNFKHAIKRISEGYYRENDTRLFEDKNRKRQRRWTAIGTVISSFTVPIILSLYITFRMVHVSNIFLLIFISFMSVFLLLIMSSVSYSPILHIYCVNRFPTSEFIAPKIKKNKKTEQA